MNKSSVALRESIEDPAAFDRVFVRFSRDLVVFFVRRTFDAETSRDLMAETLAQAFQVRGRFLGTTPEEEAAFVWAIARHQLSGWLRRGRVARRATRRLGLEFDPMSVDDIAALERAAELGALGRVVQQHLARLPDSQRLALALRVTDELPYTEIASRLGISEQNARARVSRALARLATTLPTDPRMKEHLA